MNSDTVWIPRRTSVALYGMAAVVAAAALWAYETRIDLSVETHGIVRPDGDVVRVIAEVGGRIDRLNLKESAPVHRGDTLVQLDTRDLMLRRAALESRIDATEQRLEQLQDAFRRNFEVENQGVAVDEFQDTATRHAQQVEAAEQQSRFARADRLFREGLLSRQARDDANAALARAEAELAKWTPDAVRLKKAQAGVRLGERQREIDSTKADVTDLYHQLDQCLIEISRLSIVSPADGLIGSVSPLHPGEILAAGAAVATVIPSGYRPMIETWLPAAERQSVREGTPVRARPERILSDDTGDFDAVVHSISPDARITDTMAAHRILVEPLPFSPPLQLGAGFQLHFITRQERLLWVLFRKIKNGVNSPN